MTAGLNKRFNVWRINNQDDDLVGGAVLSGTVIYNGVLGSLQQNPSEQVLLQQGYETLETFTAIVIPGTLDIRQRDEVEVVYPPTDLNYGHRFRVVGTEVDYLSPNDPRNVRRLQLVRSVESHGNVHQ